MITLASLQRIIILEMTSIIDIFVIIGWPSDLKSVKLYSFLYPRGTSTKRVDDEIFVATDLGIIFWTSFESRGVKCLLALSDAKRVHLTRQLNWYLSFEDIFVLQWAKLFLAVTA